MFERRNFKKQAKMQLANNWIQPIVVIFVTLGISLCLSIIYMGIMYPALYALMLIPAFISGFASAFNSTFASGAFFLPIIVLSIQAVVVFIAFEGIVIIAREHYYLSFIKDNKNSTVNTFSNGLARWNKGARGYLWMYLWVSLWSLLFIIPSIVKSMAYSQMFYILIENPNINVRKAMKISIAMTKGHKGSLFVMYLSFLGWALLSLLSLGIGFLWLSPYSQTSFAYAYQYMKQDAINRKVLTAADFGQDETKYAIEGETHV